MNLPLWWILKRPGTYIPVFFLCLAPANGQMLNRECASASLGNTFVSRAGYCLPSQNQAGLGRIERNSISMQHFRPGLCPDLGVSVLSAQFATTHGAIGTTISQYGIGGLRFTSAWVAYGIAVRKGWYAGLGIHFWHATIGEKWFHHPCFSFAAGLQAVISRELTLGVHLSHPAGWYASNPLAASHPMTVTVGGAWVMLPMISSFWELELIAGYPVRWKLGFEWKEKRGLGLQIGAHDQPFTVSGGIAVNIRKWNIHTAFSYRFDRGNTPYTAFTYEW